MADLKKMLTTWHKKKKGADLWLIQSFGYLLIHTNKTQWQTTVAIMTIIKIIKTGTSTTVLCA